MGAHSLWAAVFRRGRGCQVRSDKKSPLDRSTAEVTEWAENVPRGVLEHGWGNNYGQKRGLRRAGRLLHSLALGRNDKYWPR